MTHTKNEALKLALEALEYLLENKTIHYTYRTKADAAITAIKQAALAAPVQEPVAWDVFELRLYGAPLEKQHRVLWVDRYTHPDGSTPDLDGLLEAATKDGGIDGGAKTLYVRPLYTTPPAAQRSWVGLTDDETDTEATQHEQSHGFIQGVQWANTKLKEKNT